MSLRALVFLLALTYAGAVTITGHIYCDNYFEFFFNGNLIKKDPLTFTPHQAVKVSFEWDGTSDKTYAIMCQDFATPSGYEYTATSSPQLGDGALIAYFDDGTATTKDWKMFVTKNGPTTASVTAGCSSSNLGACVVETIATPDGWYNTSFDDSAWASVTVYTEAEAGWGRTPSWTNGQCCQPTNPLTRADLSACNMNYDVDGAAEVAVTGIVENDCLDPKAVLSTDTASFLWGAKLKEDNQILFRYTASANATVNTPVSSSAGNTKGNMGWVALFAFAACLMLAQASAF
uniref:Uncharacterized protein n=1 Tax=Eutreptiella gymnastica TaxID=73025 RepID=A0A7S1ND03_9EUGL|mmetsp:Transcript_17030/g.30393  ORF Transcript_17030/g.30393 Transcript_17030/m.30393 type:complete len:290 (+) Transcript_17030:31-900(+)